MNKKYNLIDFNKPFEKEQKKRNDNINRCSDMEAGTRTERETHNHRHMNSRNSH